MIVLPKMDSLNLVMKKQKTNQIEGHSRKQAPHNIQRCQVYESQGKFVIIQDWGKQVKCNMGFWTGYFYYSFCYEDIIGTSSETWCGRDGNVLMLISWFLDFNGFIRVMEENVLVCTKYILREGDRSSGCQFNLKCFVP